MRVLILVSRDVIDDARAIRQAGSLRHAGHVVKIICWDREGQFGRLAEIEGVPIERVHATGLMRLVPGQALRNPIWWRRATMLAQAWRPDVVVCHDLDALPPGIRLKRRLGCKIIYDACELFYHMIVDKVPRIVSRAALALERRLVPHVDHIIIVDDPYRAYFKDQVPFDGPVSKVMNCTWPAPTGPWPTLPGEPLTMFYAGSLTADRMVVELAECARRFPGIQVILAGGGALERQVAAIAGELPNVTFLGTIPFTEVIHRMHEAHVIPALTDPSNENVRNATSLKQFEAMVAGRGILAADGCMTAKIALETSSGLALGFDTASLHAAIQRFLDEPELATRLGQAAFEAARSHYNWDTEGAAFLDVVEATCES